MRCRDATNHCVVPIGGNASLACVGQDIQIASGAGYFISKLYVGPAGDIVIIVPPSCGDQDLERIFDELRSWGSDRLDEICADYTYKTEGQAAGVIDIMARQGGATYSDRSGIYAAIDRNLSQANLKIIREGDGEFHE